MRGKFFKYFCLTVLLPFALASFTACDAIGDRLRNWGEQGRRPAKARLDEAEVARWQRDLNLSRARSLELHDSIQDFVQESNHQGMLAWKIGKAYLEAGRYDLGALYYNEALGAGSARPGDQAPDIVMFEQALPFFDEALLRHNPDPELLFEAGLCYGNAARALGWERERWQRSVQLFERMSRVVPDDVRPRYQLALLYGKVTNSELRDIPRALDHLDEVLRREEQDVSARFLRGQLLVERGELAPAIEEYRRILGILDDLHGRGVVPGRVTDNPRYQQARENLEVLEACVGGGAGCAQLAEP